MCMPKAPSPPPAPEPLPITPPQVEQGLTGKKQMSPLTAGEDNDGSKKNRKRLGRGDLRIPLSSEGSGVNYPQ